MDFEGLYNFHILLGKEIEFLRTENNKFKQEKIELQKAQKEVPPCQPTLN